MMRYLLMVLMLGFGVSPAYAFTPEFLGALAGGGAVVAGCTTPLTGSIMNEGFVGAGYENTTGWSTPAPNGTFDNDATLPGVPPIGSCTEGFKYITAAGDTNGYIRYDLGAGITYPATIYMSYYIESGSTFASGFVCTFQLDNDTSVSTYGVFKGRQWDSRLDINAVDDELGVTNNTLPGVWHEVMINLDATGAAEGSEYFVDGVSQGTFTRGNVSGRYINIGAVDSKGSPENFTLYIGRIYVDN